MKCCSLQQATTIGPGVSSYFSIFGEKKNSQASELPNPNPAGVCLYIENQKSEPSMTTSYRSNMKNLYTQIVRSRKAFVDLSTGISHILEF